MNHIYLGYDSREDIAYKVARESIIRRTSTPLQIYPLRLKHLGMLTRKIEFRQGQMWCPISDAPMSTEFAISRFCVPFLQSRGWALFADCDILCWSDIDHLFYLADPKYAVMVVKHRTQGNVEVRHDEHDEKYGPDVHGVNDKGYLIHSECERCRNAVRSSPETKMDGQIQTFYARKNWSSVVLWNLDHPGNARLTLEALNTWPGRDLHAFKWLEGAEIGELPVEWNWLINVTPGEPKAKGIWHYTLGGPWFEGKSLDQYDLAWLKESEGVVDVRGNPQETEP